MKHLIAFLTALTFIVSVNAQVSPTSRTRATASFTQVDEYVSVIKRLGIPTSNSDNLVGSTSGPNSVKLLYNTALNKLRVYNPITSTWRDANVTDLSAYYAKTEVDSLLSTKVNNTKLQLVDLNTAPASATAEGAKGEIRITDTYIYVCIATNTWVRAPLTTW